MKIACLQFAPKLGRVQDNMKTASDMLGIQYNSGELKPPADGLLWLVLPEMAFTGYNFRDAEHITPYLEPTKDGPSKHWAVATARQFGIYVTVGYPELCTDAPEEEFSSPSTVTASPPTASNTSVSLNGTTTNNPALAAEPGSTSPASTSPKAAIRYNSTVTVSPAGAVIAHVRKHFLYYTDETWSHEGHNPSLAAQPSGFFSQDLGPPLGRTSMAICMDINPYRFTAPWTAYEFANHVLASQTPLVILSTAWLTHIPPEDLLAAFLKPDQETVVYWMERFAPLKLAAEKHGIETTVVIANRMGMDPPASSFAGSSCVMRFRRGGAVEIFDVLGRAEEKVLVVDLAKTPKFTLARKEQRDL